MRVLITGASGFIGTQLATQLLARGSVADANGEQRAITELLAVDRVEGRGAWMADARVKAVVGDATDAALLASLFAEPVDTVFALGATLTSQAEVDFTLGMDVNLHGMLHLLDACRAQASAPRLVFTSSIAAFGGPLPDVVDDEVALRPRTSYGTQKAMVELLINDYARHGFVDGRALRLPVVVTRPHASGGSISDRIAGIVREPLRGRDVACPLKPETRVPLASVQAVARALLAVQALPASAFDSTRAMNLPSLSVAVGDIVEAVRQIGQWRLWPRPLGTISYAPDEAMQQIVGTWPRGFDSQRARSHGIAGDATLHEIIEHFIADQLDANA